MESSPIHITHKDKNRHLHLLLLLLPSLVFVTILAFFMRGKYSQSKIFANMTTPIPTIQVNVNNNALEARLAKTPSEQNQGLSGVRELRENEAMLFPFTQKTRTAFWMKDMFIPIDMIWIADGKIIQIDKNAQPQPEAPESQLKLYVPSQSVDAVLEVNAGWSDRNNIRVGDSVSW